MPHLTNALHTKDLPMEDVGQIDVLKGRFSE